MHRLDTYTRAGMRFSMRLRTLSKNWSAIPRASLLFCFLPLGLLLAACTGLSSSTGTGSQTSAVTTSSSQTITYSTNPHTVIIRTFYGGGLYGSLELAPDVSIYGDGTYILGSTREGKLSSTALQQLLRTLVERNGLLSMKQQQFSDTPDQNATFLEVTLNGKSNEFMYGPFGNQQESTQAMREYHQLGQALTAINQALTGPVQAYQSSNVALLVRQNFSPDLTQTIPPWTLAAFTLAQASVYECGVIPQDKVGLNPETACLKYTIPSHAILLTSAQFQTIRAQMSGQQHRTFTEGGLYYTVILRPLLPDELPQKMLAMFGSEQTGFQGVPLLTNGTVPPVPTP